MSTNDKRDHRTPPRKQDDPKNPIKDHLKSPLGYHHYLESIQRLKQQTETTITSSPSRKARPADPTNRTQISAHTRVNEGDQEGNTPRAMSKFAARLSTIFLTSRVKALDFTELMTEKLRAMMTRENPRDYYHAWAHLPRINEKGRLKELAQRKCALAEYPSNRQGPSTRTYYRG